MGQQLLEQWIRQPLLDSKKINARLDMVEALVKNAEVRLELYEDFLKKLPNLPRVIKKFMRKTDVLQECYRTYQCIQTLSSLEQTLKELDCVAVNGLIIEPLKAIEGDFANFVNMIVEVIDISAAEEGNFIVRASLDEKIQALGEKMERLLCSMKREHATAARLLELDADKELKLEQVADEGYTLRVTRKMEKNLRQNKSFEVLGTLKSGVRFTSSTLKSLNVQYQKVQKQYLESQQDIVDEISRVILSYIAPLNAVSEILATLDVLVSFAVVAETSTGCNVRPVMLDSGSGSRTLRLTDSRHPCLEVSSDLSFIPNSVHFEPGVNLLFVSGPNMAGKSTYIRQIGMIVAMAHMGCFVPCVSAEIPIVDAIFTRIGASDCVMHGVSTFMAEMIEVSSILQHATDKSLVIIDELGRGTSTYDGFGIAAAVAEHLATETKCLSLFATHFHELTRLSDQLPTVKNLHASVMTDDSHVTLLYKILTGSSDKSFGINIAEMVNFPAEVVNDARERLEILERQSSLNDSCSDVDALFATEVLQKLKRAAINGDLFERFLRALNKLKDADPEITEKELLTEALKLLA